MSNSATLSFDLLVKLSADEFAKLTVSKAVSDRDILLMITRFENDVLEKIKMKDGAGHERYLFYKQILHIMYMAMQAEENINFWKNVAVRAKMSEEFHAQNAQIYYNDLLKYKTIEEVINSGNLDKYIEEVKKKNKK
jgi:hypothetical protein